jgi:hypothetical protein
MPIRHLLRVNPGEGQSSQMTSPPRKGDEKCGRAVDERDVALTQAAVLLRVNSGCGAWKACDASLHTSTVSSIQE